MTIYRLTPLNKRLTKNPKNLLNSITYRKFKIKIVSIFSEIVKLLKRAVFLKVGVEIHSENLAGYRWKIGHLTDGNPK
tara:strand:+ start:714 stop:947 length:234 start_codon:yes stop_codon:yes gene_type:complete